MNPVLVISPHFDDAVLSTGQFLAGRPDTVVATVFTAPPKNAGVVTAYDAKCGLTDAGQAVTVRRAEDAAALALLRAEQSCWGFVDYQYGEPVDVKALSVRIVQEACAAEFVLAPLGLIHPDHVAVRQAVLDAKPRLRVPLWLYEELPARITYPEHVADALKAVQARGFAPRLGSIGTGPLDRKLAALWCYRSQIHLPEFANIHDVLVGERFWSV